MPFPLVSCATDLVRAAIAFGLTAAVPTTADPASVAAAVAAGSHVASAGGAFVWHDDFDAYAEGSMLAGQGGWQAWVGGFGEGEVTTVHLDAPHGLAIDGDDLVQTFTGLTSGTWTVVAHQLIPDDASGQSFFIMLRRYDPGGAGIDWSLQLLIDADHDYVTDFDVLGPELPLRRGEWVPIRVVVDLDADRVKAWYGDDLLTDRPWSFGGDVAIAAIDLYSEAGAVVHYDDMILSGRTVHNATADLWHPTIQEAIDGASNGDEIVVYPGTYEERVTLEAPMRIRSSSGDPAHVVIDARQRGRPMTVGGVPVGEVRLEGLTLSGGLASSGGGLLIDDVASIAVDRCRIVGNVAETSGGGLRVAGASSCAITGTRIVGNIAILGGGVALSGSGGATSLVACAIRENQAPYSAGIDTGLETSLRLEACVIEANVSESLPPPDSAGWGGTALWGEGSVVMSNCLVRGNRGGVAVVAGFEEPLLVTSCTLVDNQGAIIAVGGATIDNCILYDNGLEPILVHDGVTVNHSNVEGGWSGAGVFNINSDPRFIDTASGDHRLLDGSPCIDAGDRRSPGTGLLDLDGNERRRHCQVDMGCYESPYFADCNGNGEPDACELDEIVDGGFDEGGTHWELVHLGPWHGYASFDGVAEVVGPNETSGGGGDPSTTVISPLPGPFHGTTFTFTLVDYHSGDDKECTGGSMDFPVVAIDGLLFALNHDGSVSGPIRDPGNCLETGTIENDVEPVEPIVFVIDVLGLVGPGPHEIGVGVHSVDCWGGRGIAIVDDLSSGEPDLNGDGVPDECTCPGDIDHDGEVGFGDLLAVLAQWGSCSDCPADLDHDGVVGFSELVAVLSAWGPC